MSDWRKGLAVGDHVSFRYVDQVSTNVLHSALPVVDGVIVSLPMEPSPYFEIEVATLPPELFISAYVSDEGQEFPHLAHPDDLVALLPRTMEREDVESWLAQG